VAGALNIYLLYAIVGILITLLLLVVV